MSQQIGKKQTFFSSILEFAGLLLIVFLIRTFGFGLYQVPSGSMETTMLVGERFFADKFTYLVRSPKRGEVIAFNAPEGVFTYSKDTLKKLFQEYVWGPDNLTKRVIGLPGDHVRGAIENGKPVLYINNEKLHEPYLNTYPLVRVFKQDPQAIQAKVEAEMQAARNRGQLNERVLGRILQENYAGKEELRSYDPSYSFEEQPFYRMNPDWVVRDADGKPMLTEPGMPLPESRGKMPDVFDIRLGENQYWMMGDNRLGSSDSRFFGPIDERLIHGRIVFRIWSIDSDESWWILDLIKHPIDFWKRVRWNRFFDVIK